MEGTSVTRNGAAGEYIVSAAHDGFPRWASRGQGQDRMLGDVVFGVQIVNGMERMAGMARKRDLDTNSQSTSALALAFDIDFDT
jgi:hypothetical protein